MKSLMIISLSLFAFTTVHADESKCIGCDKCAVGCVCGCTKTGVCNCNPCKCSKECACACGCSETGQCACPKETCPCPKKNK